MKEFDEAIQQLGKILLFINATLYTYSYLKGYKNKAIKYFAIYLTLTFCVLIGSNLIVQFQRKFNFELNNLYLSHFYFIFQFIFLSLFYSQLFNKKQKKYLNSISILVFLVLIIQYTLNTALFSQFNLLEILITSFPLVIYSIFHLYNSLSKPGKYMYINAGVLIYLSISTLIFFLGNYVPKINDTLAFNVWFLNRVFYVGYLILILIEWKKSLWKTKN
ncbi:hypothetical protein FG167_03775 [Lacinutrix sp. WUR7]|uniref:hypothetical protein n=1 Tax=Lacinutrix sp. WUR7 TaxID=2653681 RepID=UPI00193E1F15|nr:hypothetical protein [Lacinutrix sp. WUR7]QRM88376.1 hypothetical protein FG167_03775 [Lacinutrix sp. WUR7]